MAIDFQLPPLETVEESTGWVQGNAGPSDETSHFGFSSAVGAAPPMDYNNAPMLEQLINEVQGRRDHIGMPRFPFAYGLGTQDVTGLVSALADQGIETFAGGFVFRPVFFGFDSVDLNQGFINRYLLAHSYAPEDENETEALFEVDIVDFQGEFGIEQAWRWRKDGGAWTSVFTGFNLEASLEGEVKIIFAGATNDTVFLGYSTDPGVVETGEWPWIDWGLSYPNHVAQDRWSFRMVKELRRTDVNIAAILVNQCMDAIEECARGRGVRNVDLGEGLEERKLIWTDLDETKYTGKALVFDCDVEGVGGFRLFDYALNSYFGEDVFRLLNGGMASAIRQVRGIIDGLLYARAQWKAADDRIGMSVTGPADWVGRLVVDENFQTDPLMVDFPDYVAPLKMIDALGPLVWTELLDATTLFYKYNARRNLWSFRISGFSAEAEGIIYFEGSVMNDPNTNIPGDPTLVDASHLLDLEFSIGISNASFHADLQNHSPGIDLITDFPLPNFPGASTGIPALGLTTVLRLPIDLSTKVQEGSTYAVYVYARKLSQVSLPNHSFWVPPSMIPSGVGSAFIKAQGANLSNGFVLKDSLGNTII